MDFNTVIQNVEAHINVLSITLLVLLITSEILGSNPNIKASSIYGVIKVLLQTVVDQVWPKTPPTA